MNKTKGKTTLEILKNSVVEEILKVIMNRKKATTITKEAFEICDEKTKILDAFFENCSQENKEGYIKRSLTCMDIASELANMCKFSDAEIITYMFTHNYKLFKSYSNVCWIVYEKFERENFEYD